MSLNTTFSVRLKTADYETIAGLAAMDGIPVAEVARIALLEWMVKALDPAAIEQRMEARKQQLLAAARELRAHG